MNSIFADVSARDLRKAAALKERIEVLQGELSRLLGTGGGSSGGRMTSTVSTPRRGRRRMSAAAKARLAEIARARWKKAKAAGKTRL